MAYNAKEPNPQTWTMRLKHHKTTVLIHVHPLQTLASVKTDLLSVLQELHSSGFHGSELPSSASDILLAKPIDPLDISQGWEPLDPGSSSDSDDPFIINIDEDDEPKPRSKKELKSENLKAYGIKDNAVLAFRFRGEKVVGNMWDVVQAVNIDEFGVENEGDMGVHREYKG